ncbi:hypothetical protein SAMN04488589_0605 [Methanolobus vulcani]|jgi:hypothetical protein|uniref:Uncharacterized protein n=1 Tax=Methanolobus vulcani TaxID=38026 RepID=A0A7Z7AV95_9EURY|nr:hypothetical protein [Methanolobus vulcani]SDF46555.1 hypothetical protein SAMN04488589_0605 [Methanolobus vulcani]
MGRVFNEMDNQIFNKLAPELSGNTMSNAGHNYPFILRPVSHKIAVDADDFRARMDKLDIEEMEYLFQLAMEGKEDIRSLEEEDVDTFIELVEEKLSTEKMKELKAKLGMA